MKKNNNELSHLNSAILRLIRKQYPDKKFHPDNLCEVGEVQDGSLYYRIRRTSDPVIMDGKMGPYNRQAFFVGSAEMNNYILSRIHALERTQRRTRGGQRRISQRKLELQQARALLGPNIHKT